ncbi:MAG: hypothetical protein PHO83_18085 [Geobacteraceae bacterium]|nr:hypothetical protein [Geobacteraceae bacterium]
MKKTSLIIAAATLALSVPLTVGAMEHDGHGTAHAQQGDQMIHAGSVAHQEVVDGVKVTFSVIDMRASIKGTAAVKEMKETHHLMLMFADAKTGKHLNEGTVKIKIVAPDKSEQMKSLEGMGGHFGSDVAMPAKGKYGIMAKFLLKDGKVRSSKFWYQVK